MAWRSSPPCAGKHGGPGEHGPSCPDGNRNAVAPQRGHCGSYFGTTAERWAHGRPPLVKQPRFPYRSVLFRHHDEFRIGFDTQLANVLTQHLHG